MPDEKQQGDERVFTTDEFERALKGKTPVGEPIDKDRALREAVDTTNALARAVREEIPIDDIGTRRVIKDLLLPGEHNLQKLQAFKKTVEKQGYLFLNTDEARQLYNTWNLATYEAGYTYMTPVKKEHQPLISLVQGWIHIYPQQRLVYRKEGGDKEQWVDTGLRYEITTDVVFTQNYLLDHARLPDPGDVQRHVIKRMNEHLKPDQQLDPDAEYRVLIVDDATKLPSLDNR